MKRKEDLKVSWGAVVFFIIVISAIFTLAWYSVHREEELQDNQCLVDIAKAYCESKMEDYYELHWEFGYEQFVCKEDLRKVGGFEYYDFLPEELDRCLK